MNENFSNFQACETGELWALKCFIILMIEKITKDAHNYISLHKPLRCSEVKYLLKALPSQAVGLYCYLYKEYNTFFGNALCRLPNGKLFLKHCCDLFTTGKNCVTFENIEVSNLVKVQKANEKAITDLLSKSGRPYKKSVIKFFTLRVVHEILLTSHENLSTK